MLLDMAGSTSRPALRADARRNRDAILGAARQVFAEEGPGVALDRISSRAGVGRATMQRHFKTRADLVRAIFDDNFDQLEQIAGEAGADPGAEYERILLATAEMQARERGFVELFEHGGFSEEARQEIGDRFLSLVAGPLARAQAVGRVRSDLRPDDTMLLLDMLAAAATPVGIARPADRLERGMRLVREAIRAEGAARPLA